MINKLPFHFVRRHGLNTGGGSGPPTWGDVVGTLSDQSDLVAALAGKVNVGDDPYPQVADHASLPSAAANTGEIYIVQTTTGIIGVRKLAGLWRSDGAAWNYLGLYGRNASEIANVPGAGSSATDVQAAIDDIGGRSTDGWAEGSSNLYFTAARVRSTLLTGISLASAAVVSATDTVLAAIGQLQAQITALTATVSGKEPTISAGTTVQYFRGDKTFQPLDKSAVGLANVDNTSDAAKPISTATSTALSGKSDTGHGHAASAISDFTEASQDVVGAMVVAAGGTYDDALGAVVFPGGGGGGSPGGADGSVQYRSGAAFAGAANVAISSDNLKLVSTTDPAAPTGGVVIYSKIIAGRHLPKMIGPSGIDTILQVGLSGNAVFMVAPASGTTAPTAWGGTLTTAATMSVQQTIASANPWQATWRKRFASAATAGSVTGMRTAYAPWFRGNAVGFGGFFFRAQFGQNINLNGAQAFVGLCASTGALAATAGAVSALLNMIGVGFDTTDANTGNWQLFRNDGSSTATKVDLGANAARNTTHGFDLIIYCPPGAATEIFVRIVNIHSGVVVLDTSYTTDIPAVNVGMAFKSECNNGAVASATNLEVAKVYIESDY